MNLKYKKIGIIGGLAPISTQDYYNQIITKYYKKKKDLFYPEILIHSLCFGEVINRNYVITNKLKKAIINLKNSGADFIIAACNSIHIDHKKIQKIIDIPWINISLPTIKYLIKHKKRKVLFLSTKYTYKNKDYFQNFKKNKIEIVVPSNFEIKKLNNYIYKELVFKKISKNGEKFLKKLVHKYKEKNIEAIILGCTELKYAFKNKKYMNIDLIDTNELHCDFALNYSINVIKKISF